MNPDSSGTWPNSAWFSSLDVPHQDWPDIAGSHLLGIRFEQMMHEWLKASADFTLIATNLQVSDDTRTIGEFDLLVENHGQLEHWELAIKFYLGTGDLKSMDNWHGPNPTDTLATKVSRLNSHQLMLGRHPAATALLADRELEIQHTRSFLKGRLFHPISGFLHDALVFPGAVNPDHERGWWMAVSDFCESNPFDPDYRYLPLEKPQWMAVVTPDESSDCLTLADTCALLQGGRGTQHLALINIQGDEVSRGFVVFDDWLAELETLKQSASP
jgi:hypothetical protein